jgi:hypothetical protein
MVATHSHPAAHAHAATHVTAAHVAAAAVEAAAAATGICRCRCADKGSSAEARDRCQSKQYFPKLDHDSLQRLSVLSSSRLLALLVAGRWSGGCDAGHKMRDCRRRPATERSWGRGDLG